jgi:hypothetical protein
LLVIEHFSDSRKKSRVVRKKFLKPGKKSTANRRRYRVRGKIPTAHKEEDFSGLSQEVFRTAQGDASRQKE